jgi:hypothetical protein
MIIIISVNLVLVVTLVPTAAMNTMTLEDCPKVTDSLQKEFLHLQQTLY